MHGDEGRSEDQCDHNHKLHARMHAVQRKNAGRVLELDRPKVKVFCRMD